MPGSRHPHRRIGLIGLAVIALTAAGCYQQPETPRQFVPGNDLYDQFTSEGQRLIVERPGPDEPSMKVRTRSRDTRVYDQNLSPVGRVSTGGETIEQHPLAGETDRSVQSIDGGAELADGWRIEDAGREWHIDGPDGDRIATLTAGGDRWTLHRRADDTTYTVETDDGVSRVVSTDGSAAIAEVATDEWSRPEVLVLALETLEPLDRYALVAWVGRNLDE